MERESDVEHYFVERCKKFGYLTYKFVSPGQAGVPDRIAIDDVHQVSFIEFKATIDNYPRPLQFKQIEKLANFGQIVYVLRSKSEVDWYFFGDGDIPTDWDVLRDERKHNKF